MLRKNSSARRSQNASDYSTSHAARYVDQSKDNKNRAVNKRIIAVIAVLCVAILAAAVSLVVTLNADHIGHRTDEAKGAYTAFAPSEDDVELLATQGYDAVSLTKKAQQFAERFFTLDAASVNDGSWAQSYAELVDSDLANDLNTENLVTMRATDTWERMFSNHPYYMNEIDSFDSIDWDITYYNDEPLPYCDLTMTIIRPELDFYSLNSVEMAFARFQDTYRITFDADGNVIKVKRTGAKLLDSGLYEEEAYLDAQAAQAYYKELYESGNANTIKEAEAEAARLEAESKARQEAIQEAERLAKEKAEADEKARKEAEAAKAEADKNKNDSSGSSSNGNSNSGSNSNTGGNSNTSSGNQNTSGTTTPTTPDSGNAGGGAENGGAAAQSAE